MPPGEVHGGATWMLTKRRAAKELLIPFDELEDRLTTTEWGDLLCIWQMEADRDEKRNEPTQSSVNVRERRLI